MAAAAEARQKEEYAHSLSTLRRLGEFLVDSVVESQEERPIRELAFADFSSAATEMLKTDKEFRPSLDINNKSEYPVVDNEVRVTDGRSMVAIIATGHKKSLEAARSQPELNVQVIRDAGDLENARYVNKLRVGMTRIVVSMKPKEELKTYKKTYADLGYKEGLAYIQWYSRADENTLVAGSYSVDMSNEATWRELFASFGVTIPEDESPNTWIRHAIELQATPAEAEQLVCSIRERYYKQRGCNGKRYSVSEYVANHSAVIQRIFDSYYPALAEAVHSGRNSERLQALATAMLQADIKDLKPEIRRQLSRIGNSHYFDDESGRVMDSIIRYAAVEELRKGLPSLVSKILVPKAYIAPKQSFGYSSHVIYGIPPQELHQLLANNVHSGVQARRSYAGCAGQIQFSSEQKNTLNASEGDINRQEAFGGNLSSDTRSESTGGVCEYVHDNCYCCPYDDDGRVLGRKVKVRARRDSRGVARCLRTGCGAALDEKGNVLDIGEIAKKAQKLAAQAGTVFRQAGVESFEVEEQKTQQKRPAEPAIA